MQQDELAGKRLVLPTNDLLFKRVLANAEHPSVTLGFINDMLGLNACSVHIENPYDINTFKDNLKQGKLYKTEVDVLVRLSDNRLVSVEMQAQTETYLLERVLYYAASRYTANYGNDEHPDLGKAIPGIKYSSLYPVYGISVLDFTLFKNDADALRSYLLYDILHQQSYCDALGLEMLKLTFLELTKRPVTQRIADWANFFKGKKPRRDIPGYIKEAYELSNFQNLSREERDMISAEERAEQRQKSHDHYVMTEGTKQGLEQGRQEIAKNALREGLPLETVQKITGLDIQTLKALEEN
jgi:predicted transposase/invertase (TIGR01784 family)